ncbi:phage tail tape measure protein [Pantoea vagans]|uniref:phage tail tape measure protein n=1 Tax=Pantoea vagans TaxID=470934 RepID=UPI00289F57A2|nr:phage tail tape measure protein [Pantoea vagans]
MSILDSFFFVLKADSKDAVAGINKTGQEFEGLKTDVKVGTGDISRHFETMGANVGESLSGMAKGLAVVAAGALAGIASLDAFGDHVTQVIQKASDAQSLGINIGDYDALSQALRGAGLEADEARDLFVDLNEAIGEGASDAGSQRAKTFAQLGISLKDASGQARNAADIFGDLAAAADKLNPQQFTFMIRQLGINDPKTIQMLQLGSKNLQQQIGLAKQRGVMDEQQQQAAIKLAHAQRELSAQINRIGDAIASAAIPAIAGFLSAVTAVIDYVEEHKNFFITAFGVAAVGAVWALRGQVLGLIPVITRMAGATLVAVGPWLLIGAAIASVALIAEDLYTYFTDPTASTVTGALAEKFSSVRDFLEASKAEVMALWDAVKSFGTSAVEIWNSIITAINSLNDNDSFTAFVDGAKTKFTELRDWLQQWGRAIGDFLYNIFANVVNGAIDTLNTLPGVQLERMQTGDERQAERRTTEQAQTLAGDVAAITAGVPVIPSVAAANGVVADASTSPLNSISNNATSIQQAGNTTNAPVNIERVEVNTQSTDPQAIKAAFGEGIADQWKNSVAQHDDGISH